MFKMISNLTYSAFPYSTLFGICVLKTFSPDVSSNVGLSSIFFWIHLNPGHSSILLNERRVEHSVADWPSGERLSFCQTTRVQVPAQSLHCWRGNEHESNPTPGIQMQLFLCDGEQKAKYCFLKRDHMTFWFNHEWLIKCKGTMRLIKTASDQ